MPKNEFHSQKIWPQNPCCFSSLKDCNQALLKPLSSRHERPEAWSGMEYSCLTVFIYSHLCAECKTPVPQSLCYIQLFWPFQKKQVMFFLPFRFWYSSVAIFCSLGSILNAKRVLICHPAELTIFGKRFFPEYTSTKRTVSTMGTWERLISKIFKLI